MSAKSQEEINNAVEACLRAITDTIVGNVNIRYDERVAVVDAFSRFREAIDRPLTEDKDK